MSNSKIGTTPLSSPSKTIPQRSSTSQTKHSGPFYFSDSLFRNKRLKQKRLKWQLVISKTPNPVKRKNSKKTDHRRHGKYRSTAPQPEVTINLLSDDDEPKQKQQSLASPSNKKFEQQQQRQPSSLPQIIVFPGHMQLSKVPNITLIPVQPLSLEMGASFQNRLRRKRKSQKPKRHAEPTIVNNESIVLSDDSNEADAKVTAPVGAPAACSTPNNLEALISPKPICPPPLSYFNANSMPNHHNENDDLKICTVQSVANAPHSVQVDEEVTVSLVPRSAAGSCSSKSSNAAELFRMVPDETTVQTIISNRIYELSLSKLREGLATSGVGDFADEQQKPIPPSGTRRKGTTFNLPPKLKQPNLQPVSLKLSSDLSISLISDDEDDQQQQRLNAEKLLRQQPHLSVRPVGIVTMRQPPKRRKLG